MIRRQMFHNVFFTGEHEGKMDEKFIIFCNSPVRVEIFS